METTRFFGDLHHADRLARKDDAGGRRSLMQRNRVQWVAIIAFGARNEAPIERVRQPQWQRARYDEASQLRFVVELDA